MVNLMEKLAKASENNPELKKELEVIGNKLAELSKNYPLELSAEEASAVSGGWCVFSGETGGWCVFSGK